jgi:hypothetical protein
MFRLEAVHLRAIADHVKKAGATIGMRSLYRFVDKEGDGIPRLHIAMHMANAMHELFGFDKMAVLTKLSRIEDSSTKES